ncbi:MAG: macro domain-containing protein [Methanomassiliicoccales archaeon]
MNAEVGGTELRVVREDITEMDTYAIVNAANNGLWMGPGVTGAIKEKGGEATEREAVSKGPVQVEEAVVTGTGRLKPYHVIHAAGMGEDLRTSGRKVSSATRYSLVRAGEMGVEGISLPAIGTDVDGLSPGEAARAMIDAVVEHVPATRLKLVQFVPFDEDSEAAFKDHLEGV